MAYFDDFKNAVSAYPSLSVTLSIVDLVVQPPSTAGAVNINEIWAFQVRIANNGHLNLTGVTMHLSGANGATVALAAAGPFTSILTTPAIASVNAHSTQDTGNFYFKAPNIVKPAGTQLVEVHISAFDANLNYILITSTGHSNPPTGSYKAQVFP